MPSGAYTNLGVWDPTNKGKRPYGQDALLMCATGKGVKAFGITCHGEYAGQWIDRQTSDKWYYVVESRASPVPEPGTLLLIGSGVVGMGAAVRRRGRK